MEQNRFDIIRKDGFVDDQKYMWCSIKLEDETLLVAKYLSPKEDNHHMLLLFPCQVVDDGRDIVLKPWLKKSDAMFLKIKSVNIIAFTQPDDRSKELWHYHYLTKWTQITNQQMYWNMFECPQTKHVRRHKRGRIL